MIIDYFIKKTTIEAPQSMQETFLKNLLEDEKKKNNNKEINEQEFKDKMAPYAERNIKWLFVRDQLINEESIKLEDKAIDNFIKEAIASNKKQESEIKKYYEDNNNKQNYCYHSALLTF